MLFSAIISYKTLTPIIKWREKYMNKLILVKIKKKRVQKNLDLPCINNLKIKTHYILIFVIIKTCFNFSVLLKKQYLLLSSVIYCYKPLVIK